MNGTQQPYEYSLLPEVSFTLQHSGDAFIVFTIVNTLNLFPRPPLNLNYSSIIIQPPRKAVYFCKARIS